MTGPAESAPNLARTRWALALLWSPLLLSWGFGVVHPALDLLTIPAAALSNLPHQLGAWGLVAITALALGTRKTALPSLLVLLPGLGLLASLLALGRPLPWIVPIALFVGWFRREARPALPELPSTALAAASPLLWLLCARSKPFGEGILPPSLHDSFALAMGDLPWLASGLAILLPLPLLALVPRPWGRIEGLRAGLGAAAGLLLVATFGNGQAFVAAAVFGAVAALLAPSLCGSRALVLALLLALCASGRLALTERWRCGDVAEEAQVTRLSEGGDVSSLALSAGNLAYLGLLADGGATLRRMTTTGALGDAVPLDPPGGRLLSPLVAGGPVVRVVLSEGGARVQWWDLPRLALLGEQPVPLPCVGGAVVEDADGAVLIGCEGRLVRVRPEGSEELLGGGEPQEALTGGHLLLRGGPLPRGSLQTGDAVVARSALGPFSAGLAAAPGRFLVARGPAGQVELRGPPPAIPTLYTPPEQPDARARDALSRHEDAARIGVWPEQVLWSPKQKAAWVASSVDPTVTLFDPDVTWHQVALSVGAPARQITLEPATGRLYVANRCGVFAVRIPTTSPW